MSRRLFFACALIIFASSAAASGCSSFVHPGLPQRSGTDGIQKSPQSIVHWSKKADMPTARTYLAAGVANGRLYAVGGLYESNHATKTLVAYDPITNTWVTKANMPTARAALAAAAVNGILYVIGGFGSNDSSTKVEAYDPTTDSWTTKANMPTGRVGLAAGVVDGKLYAVGGNGPFGSMDTVEAYDPTTDTWSAKRPMPEPREALAVGVVNGILYAVGGAYCPFALSCAFKSNLFAYDSATNRWSRKANMPKGARFSLAAGAVGGKLYAVGGYTGDNDLNMNRLEAYDPATNTWAEKADMPTARADLAAGAVDGELYAVGGDDGSDIGMRTVEAFDPQ